MLLFATFYMLPSAESDKIYAFLFSEQIMKTRKRFQISCHFHHDYEQQQHNVAGAGQFHEQAVLPQAKRT